MIKHIVLWRLKPQGSDAFHVIREALIGQRGRIPGLLHVEVGRNFASTRRSVDFALVCHFESRAALEAYHRHPAHFETRKVVDPLIEDHWIVDYEI